MSVWDVDSKHIRELRALEGTLCLMDLCRNYNFKKEKHEIRNNRSTYVKGRDG